MAEFFGDLERLAADLYPYRWPILAGILIVIAVDAVLAYQMGLHLWVNRHKVPAVAVGVPLLALMGFIAWDLGSPLFTNVTVEEEFPFSFSATVPQDMDREKVEDLMAVMAKVEPGPAMEPMPKEMMQQPGDAAPSLAVATGPV